MVGMVWDRRPRRAHLSSADIVGLERARGGSWKLPALAQGQRPFMAEHLVDARAEPARRGETPSPCSSLGDVLVDRYLHITSQAASSESAMRVADDDEAITPSSRSWTFGVRSGFCMVAIITRPDAVAHHADVFKATAIRISSLPRTFILDLTRRRSLWRFETGASGATGLNRSAT